MIIRISLRFEGSKGERTLYSLFESRATYSCISEKNVEGLSALMKLPKPLKYYVAGNSTFITINYVTLLDFYCDNIRLSDEFLIVPDENEQVVIGSLTMNKWKLKADFDNNTVIVDSRAAKPIFISLREKTPEHKF